jgi:hypothetical protein
MRSSLDAQLATARAIAHADSHPKKAEVRELLSVRDKGWIDDSKFGNLLQGLIF